VWVALSPRFIFDWQTTSSVGGAMELSPQSQHVLRIACTLPEAISEEYSGELSFESELFRVLNIEVDKLDGLPWPPEFSTADIPTEHQPTDIERQDITLAGLFRKAAIDARVHHNDGALGADIGTQTGRPWEEDRWDERELHEMMDTHYGRSLSEREWWLYLLITARFDGGPALDENNHFLVDDQNRILNEGVGTTGIIFDHQAGNITDPWIYFAEWFEANAPQYKHLFDFGRHGSFVNTRARQGVAVFWREMLDFVPIDEDWYRGRQFIRTIVHELGHALNLAHTWRVNRPDSTSFMNYPHRYPHGSNDWTRIRNYWRDFDYTFDAEELFHFRHGFYNEVVPGGKLEFENWTPSSVFRDPSAGGTRSNIALSVLPTKGMFRFTEPVTLEVTIKNHTAEQIAVGRLSPAYGDVRYVIRKPTGQITEYRPPLYKCEVAKDSLPGFESPTHLTSLAVGAEGFVFDSPGRYEITATIPDPTSGTLVVSRPVSIWIHYPDKVDEEVASRIFDRQAALFLYMAGGEHLEQGKHAMEEVAAAYPKHPFAAHANLVLGLNKMSGQKRAVTGTVTAADPEGALPQLKKALTSKQLSRMSTTRLKSTIDYFGDKGAKE
jgi:hypothetical protein